MHHRYAALMADDLPGEMDHGTHMKHDRASTALERSGNRVPACTHLKLKQKKKLTDFLRTFGLRDAGVCVEQ